MVPNSLSNHIRNSKKLFLVVFVHHWTCNNILTILGTLFRTLFQWPKITVIWVYVTSHFNGTISGNIGHFDYHFLFVTKTKASYLSTPATRLRQSCISTWPGTRWRWCAWWPETDHSQFSLSKTQSNWSNGWTTVWRSGPRAIWTS